jgi:hypothetical protein
MPGGLGSGRVRPERLAVFAGGLGGLQIAHPVDSFDVVNYRIWRAWWCLTNPHLARLVAGEVAGDSMPEFAVYVGVGIYALLGAGIAIAIGACRGSEFLAQNVARGCRAHYARDKGANERGLL